MIGRAILLFTLLQFFQNVLAQDVRQFYNWRLSTYFAFEQHDKRLYEWPQKELHLANHPEEFGTYWYGISLSRNILESDFFQLSVGLGYATEIQTFVRPFSLAPFADPPYPRVGVYTKNYKIKHLQIPVNYNFQLLKDVRLGVEGMIDFSFFKYPRPQLYSPVTFKKFLWDFYSLSLFPGIDINMGRWHFRFDYRILQLKKIDKVIFNGLLFDNTRPPDPRTDDLYETHNPAHMRFTLSYDFGKVKLKTRE